MEVQCRESGKESPSGRQHPVASLQADYALPAHPCAEIFQSKAYALNFFKERSVSTPALVEFVSNFYL
jgi:hypothetical protein